MKRWWSGLTIVILAGMIAAGSELASRAPRSMAMSPDPGLAPPPPAEARREMLAAMARLAGTVLPADRLDHWAKQLGGGAPLDGFLTEILASKRFSRDIIPALVFGTFVNVRNYYALPSAFVLKRTPEAVPVYYLREPCTPSEAVAVRPWWDLASEIEVCPDAYRPTKWTLSTSEHAYKSAMPLSCDSQVGSPELETASLCGCGPNLIRCLRDTEQYAAHNQSLMDEVRLTTAYVVEHDLPIASLFTGNATFRDRNVELYYRRQKINALQLADAARELADLAQWPEEGRWAPREELKPSQHAGLLTAPQILHALPDRRQRQRGYYEIMWCAMRNSFGATTRRILELNTTGNLAFVHDSWKRLAHTEMCTNCHARLDYGFQFFLGYPDSRASTHFDPALQGDATGPLYGRDVDDPRGTGPLTPLGFAQLATAQPEFEACMANHFVTYVLGGRATGEDRRAIEDAVARTGRFRPVMKVALERYAAKWQADAAAAPERGFWPGAAPGSPLVAISPALRGKLETYCSDCHGADAVPYDPDRDVEPYTFSAAALPRTLVVRMTDHVAFGIMPKGNPLDPREREATVAALIDALWAAPDARLEAENYYLGGARGLPAQQIDNAFHLIEQHARAPSRITAGALERALWSDQATITPGFLTLTSLAALDACRQAQQVTGEQLDACLARALSLPVLARGPR